MTRWNTSGRCADAACHLALLQGRPSIQIVLPSRKVNRQSKRDLVADTGAGSESALFELILEEHEFLSYVRRAVSKIRLGGAYSGLFSVYRLRVEIPQIGSKHQINVVGVPSVPSGFDGIACFRFLNRFNYGNFGDPVQFGIEAA